MNRIVIVILVSLFCCAQTHAQVINNVVASWNGKLMEIKYDISKVRLNAPNDVIYITVLASKDNGKNFNIHLKHVTGELDSITTNGRKTIYWDPIKEWGSYEGNVQFMVTSENRPDRSFLINDTNIELERVSEYVEGGYLIIVFNIKSKTDKKIKIHKDKSNPCEIYDPTGQVTTSLPLNILFDGVEISNYSLKANKPVNVKVVLGRMNTKVNTISKVTIPYNYGEQFSLTGLNLKL